jgi:molybdopterin-biosynthesis enzyme MoeA-like protein
MRQLHASEGDGSGTEGLKAEHRRAATLDGAMVLLNDIVEIPGFAYHHRSQIRIFFP